MYKRQVVQTPTLLIMTQEQTRIMARVFLIFLDVLTHKHVTTMIQQIPMMARVFMLKLIMIVTENA